MPPITCEDDIERGLDWLYMADPRLVPVRQRVEAVRSVSLRLDEPGFAPLVEIVCSQQISRASAAAIHARLVDRLVPLSPERVAAMTDEDARAIGLSKPKARTLRNVAGAVLDGTLDLTALRNLSADEATERICAVHGLGPWTAGVYLLFCEGHPDIFPSGDIALQWSAADTLNETNPVQTKRLDTLAKAWSPWRSVAARLLWANYAVLKGREVVP